MSATDCRCCHEGQPCACCALHRAEVPSPAAQQQLTPRQAARQRVPLDVADVQALEGALSLTERERNEARAHVALLREALEDIIANTQTEPRPFVGDPIHQLANVHTRAGIALDATPAQAAAELAALRADNERMREVLRRVRLPSPELAELRTVLEAARWTERENTNGARCDKCGGLVHDSAWRGALRDAIAEADKAKEGT